METLENLEKYKKYKEEKTFIFPQAIDDHILVSFYIFMSEKQSINT